MKKALLLCLLFPLIGFGQEIVEFSLSDCDQGSYPQFTKNRLISKGYRSDTLFLKLGMVLNCGIEPLPMVKLSGDSIFVAFNDTSNSYTMCDCCFEVNFTLANISDTNFTVFYGLKHSTYGNQEDEIYYLKLIRHENKYIFPSYVELEEAMASQHPNQVDENGERIGIWIQSDYQGENAPFSVISYKKDKHQQSKAQWIVRFSGGEIAIIKEVMARVGVDTLTSIEGRIYYELVGVTPITD